MTAPAAPATPPCVCGHDFGAHEIVHLRGCIGDPAKGCGPDCRNECCRIDCECREFEPAPATTGATPDDLDARIIARAAHLLGAREPCPCGLHPQNPSWCLHGYRTALQDAERRARDAGDALALADTRLSAVEGALRGLVDAYECASTVDFPAHEYSTCGAGDANADRGCYGCQFMRALAAARRAVEGRDNG